MSALVQRLVLAVCASFFAASAIAAEAVGAIGTITILEGSALVTRGINRLQVVEGVRLESGDLLDMGAPGFMQVELPDRTILQLGAGTRAMVQAGTDRQKPVRSMHILSGWLKQSSQQRDAKAAPGLEVRSSLIEIPPQPGVMVVRFEASSVAVFAESGEAKILERQDKGNPVSVGLKPGDVYVRKSGAKGIVDPAARAAFVRDMPPVFRDSLPARAARFEKAVPPKPAPAFTYADVEGWLKAEPAIRRPLVQRWRAKANEAPFRAALVANLSAHPEWDPVLFPEKYRPKPAPETPPAVATPTPQPAALPAPAASTLPPPVTGIPATRSVSPAPGNTLPAPVQSLPPPAQ